MVEVWTDGSCLGNPGKGGWAFLAKTENNTFESSGGEKFTTNNKMELTAVIKALEYLKENNIKNVKFNKLIGSVTIEYDHEIFPKNLWEDLLKGQNLEEISTRVNEVAKEVKYA